MKKDRPIIRNRYTTYYGMARTWGVVLFLLLIGALICVIILEFRILFAYEGMTDIYKGLLLE